MLRSRNGLRYEMVYLDFRDSIERVVYLSPRGIENVIYKNVYYELRSPHEMEEVVRRHVADKGAVNISGKSLHYRQSDQTFDAYPFIDITANKARERYRQRRDGWLRSDDYNGSRRLRQKRRSA